MCCVASIPLPISLHDPVATTWGLTLGMSGLKTRQRVSPPAWPWVAPEPTPAVHVLRAEHAKQYSIAILAGALCPMWLLPRTQVPRPPCRNGSQPGAARQSGLDGQHRMGWGSAAGVPCGDGLGQGSWEIRGAPPPGSPVGV